MTVRAGKRLLTQEDWITAGYDALAAGGVAAVSVDALARSLGVTRGSFYWHFAGRRELLDAVFARWQRENTTEMIPEAVGIEDPVERLRLVFREVVRPADRPGRARARRRGGASARRAGRRPRHRGPAELPARHLHRPGAPGRCGGAAGLARRTGSISGTTSWPEPARVRPASTASSSSWCPHDHGARGPRRPRRLPAARHRVRGGPAPAGAAAPAQRTAVRPQRRRLGARVPAPPGRPDGVPLRGRRRTASAIRRTRCARPGRSATSPSSSSPAMPPRRGWPRRIRSPLCRPRAARGCGRRPTRTRSSRSRCSSSTTARSTSAWPSSRA